MVDEKNPIPTVLVVDDEPLLRMDAVDLLEESGFAPIEARDATEAICILTTRSDVRVLFTDINMPPGPSGLALAEEVHRRWPNVLLVVTSAGTIIADKDVPDHGRFIAKPYAPEDLKMQIDDMISKADDGLSKPPA